MGAHLVGDHFFGTPCRRVLANPGFGSGILKLLLTNSGKWIMPGSFLTVIDLPLKMFFLIYICLYNFDFRLHLTFGVPFAQMLLCNIRFNIRLLHLVRLSFPQVTSGVSGCRLWAFGSFSLLNPFEQFLFITQSRNVFFS